MPTNALIPYQVGSTLNESNENAGLRNKGIVENDMASTKK